MAPVQQARPETQATRPAGGQMISQGPSEAGGKSPAQAISMALSALDEARGVVPEIEAAFSVRAGGPPRRE